jgi:hypothetical protein
MDLFGFPAASIWNHTDTDIQRGMKSGHFCRHFLVMARTHAPYRQKITRIPGESIRRALLQNNVRE